MLPPFLREHFLVHRGNGASDIFGAGDVQKLWPRFPPLSVNCPVSATKPWSFQYPRYVVTFVVHYNHNLAELQYMLR